ncbi:Fic family protein [Pontiellaceae bacterium B1224]|nr:Fic family protein [Pontiellaceae bacterium B1224]
MMEISGLVGRVEGLALANPSPKLRHNNRVRTIQGSVGIEGNTCSVAQVDAIAEGKRVPVSELEQIEVRNALKAYASLASFDHASIESLLSAHAQLMGHGLILNPGHFRKGPVEVYVSENRTRLMPHQDLVPELMEGLFTYLRESDDSTLLKSVRFHFEFVNIHPFGDGNGRTARLWQTRLLMEYHPVFEFLDVESMIFEHRPEYYACIREAQDSGNSACFVEFILRQIQRSISNLWKADWSTTNTVEERLDLAKQQLGKETFTRKEYLQLFKTISPVTASRDLKWGTDAGLLLRTGDRRTAVYRFVDSE